MFQKNIITTPNDIFNQLSISAIFEDINDGRKGANLVDYKNGLIPIVRTTTKYNNPNQYFKPIHYDIIKQIGNSQLNNALIEIYDYKYKKMGFHTDQTLDLEENSYICIFSCYDNKIQTRKLVIKEKETNKESTIVLEHNSVITFSVETNKRYLHKIILEDNQSDNKWLGITFRLSKRFIKFIDEIPYFAYSNNKLRLADKDENKSFFMNKSMENQSIDFIYPELDYTISLGDILPIL